MMDCCNPGSLPDASLVAALLDLVSLGGLDANPKGIYPAPYEYHILLTMDPVVVVVSHGLAPLLWQLGLDTEQITVPFSSKGVKHMAYLAHVATVLWYIQQM